MTDRRGPIASRGQMRINGSSVTAGTPRTTDRLVRTTLIYCALAFTTALGACRESAATPEGKVDQPGAASAGPETLLAVYVPTNHLYLGDVLLCPPSRAVFPRMTVEEGIRVFLTGGMALAQRVDVEPAADLPAGPSRNS